MTLKTSDKWFKISSLIEACNEDIVNSVNSNILKLNKDKTKFIVFSSRKQKLRIFALRHDPVIYISHCLSDDDDWCFVGYFCTHGRLNGPSDLQM